MSEQNLGSILQQIKPLYSCRSCGIQSTNRNLFVQVTCSGGELVCKQCIGQSEVTVMRTYKLEFDSSPGGFVLAALQEMFGMGDDGLIQLDSDVQVVTVAMALDGLKVQSYKLNRVA